MKTLTVILMALALLGVAGAAEKSEKKAAPMAASPPAPRPAPEVDQLKYFLGAWRCEGTDFAGPLGPERPMKLTITAKMDLDGFWVVHRFSEKKTKENPNPLKGVYAWTYDPGQKKFVATWNDNTGGWATQTSDGWEGNKFVLVGDYTSGGQRMLFRDTYVKKSDRELTRSGEMNVKDQWVKADESTCTK